MGVTFDQRKFMSKLPSIAHKLTAQQRKVFLFAVKRARNTKDFHYIKEYLANPNKWRVPKVSFDTFLDDPYYLGVGNNVYPKVREICREIVEGGYREGVEVAGIGSGKSFSSQILACYAAHHLLCLKNPHDYYGLAKDKAIAIMNMGTSATQALQVVFTGIKSFIEASPFFLNWKPKVMNNQIIFLREKILLISGNSKATTPLGYNVFYAILDEAAFYTSNEDKDVAQEIYESLQRRIVSRFGNDGLIMMISSPRYVGDFIMKQLHYAWEKDAFGNPLSKHILGIQLPTWKVKDKKRADLDNKFFFNPRTGKILEESQEDLEKQFNINFIDNPDFDDTYDIREIPGEYKESFKKNPDKAKRDFGAAPSASMEGFFPNPKILNTMWNDARKNPADGSGKYRFEGRPERVQYYVHIDLGLNRKGKGDATGMAMGHFDGRYEDEETGETRMQYKIDFAEQITVKEGEMEIELADIRRRLYDLKAMGYNIALVTLDGFQSKDFRQILQKKGFKTDYLSVDRQLEPYNLLKEAIYEERIDIPYHEVLSRELSNLELVNGNKVDHPPKGSKDVADAVAGVIANIAENTPKGTMGVRTISQGGPENLALAQHRAQKQKEERVRKQQEALNRQNEIARRLGL